MLSFVGQARCLHPEFNLKGCAAVSEDQLGEILVFGPLKELGCRNKRFTFRWLG
jgi:hypothetical protein